MILLALRAEDDQRTLLDYAKELYLETGLVVSIKTVDNFFKKRFLFRGSLRKSNLVPMDKFKLTNVQKYLEFMEKIDKLDNRWKYHWVDEKHVVNGDCQSKTVRADPLNGRIRKILVNRILSGRLIR